MFYVYIYFDPRVEDSFIYSDLSFNYEPFYIGKGKGNRLYSHLKQTGRTLKTNKINSIRNKGFEPIVLKYKENLSEEEAFKLEVELINKIGRRNLKNGPLTNIHEGGKGGNLKGELNTFYGKHHTEGHKEYISNYIKNWCKENPDVIAKAKLKRAETFKKIDFNFSTFKNRKHSEESKLKMKGQDKSGNKNSQFGTMWITNGTENKKIKTTDTIPNGFYKGRKIKEVG